MTDRTKAEDRMESGTFVGFPMKSSEYILTASGHETDLGTGKKRQFEPWESGVNATPNWTKHPSPSRLLKQDRQGECT